MSIVFKSSGLTEQKKNLTSYHLQKAQRADEKTIDNTIRHHDRHKIALYYADKQYHSVPF